MADKTDDELDEALEVHALIQKTLLACADLHNLVPHIFLSGLLFTVALASRRVGITKEAYLRGCDVHWDLTEMLSPNEPEVLFDITSHNKE